MIPPPLPPRDGFKQIESKSKLKEKAHAPTQSEATNQTEATNAIASVVKKELAASSKEKPSLSDKIKNKFKSVKKEGVSGLDNKVIQVQHGLNKGVHLLKEAKDRLTSPWHSAHRTAQLSENLANASIPLQPPTSVFTKTWPQRSATAQRPYITYYREDHPGGKKMLSDLTQGKDNRIEPVPLTEDAHSPKVPHQYRRDIPNAEEFKLNGVVYPPADLIENYEALIQAAGSNKNARLIACMLVQSTMADEWGTARGAFQAAEGKWDCGHLTGMRYAVDIKDGIVKITFKMAYKAKPEMSTVEGSPPPGSMLAKRVITFALSDLDNIALPPEGESVPDHIHPNPFPDAVVEDDLSSLITSGDVQQMLKDF